MRSVTLLFPAMLRTGSSEPDAFARLRLPALELLLSRSTHVTADCADEAVWLGRRFGVEKSAEVPVAALSLTGEGIDSGEGFWLRADPVHLEVQHARLVLRTADCLVLTAEESGELARSLHGYFSARNLRFLAPNPERWYLGVPGNPDIRTVSLSEASGRDVNRLLPRGPDRMRWHQLFNESQMLLHDHPVNVAREARGLPAVNSLWFWGGGRLPEACSPFDAVAAGGALLRGLARAAGLTAVETTGLIVPEQGHVLAELSPATSGEAGAVSHLVQLRQLEQRWFAPALAALRAGRLDYIELATIAAGFSHEWTLTRGGLYRFWRRTLPLADQTRRIATAPG